jgi:hypothetical protein
MNFDAPDLTLPHGRNGSFIRNQGRAEFGEIENADRAPRQGRHHEANHDEQPEIVAPGGRELFAKEPLNKQHQSDQDGRLPGASPQPYKQRLLTCEEPLHVISPSLKGSSSIV